MCRFIGVREKIAIVRHGATVITVVSLCPVKGYDIDVRFDLNQSACKADDKLPAERKFSVEYSVPRPL